MHTLALFLLLATASGWHAAVRPSSLPHASSPGAALRVSRLRMASDDELAHEFQSLVRLRSSVLLGQPVELLEDHKISQTWILIFNTGQQGV